MPFDSILMLTTVIAAVSIVLIAYALYLIRERRHEDRQFHEVMKIRISDITKY